MRAERRLGECIRVQKETVGLNEGALRRGADMEPRDARPTLADAGIDKKLSSRAQKLAPLPFSAMNSTPAASGAARPTRGCRSRWRGSARL
jgi:hypothetical protein